MYRYIVVMLRPVDASPLTDACVNVRIEPALAVDARLIAAWDALAQSASEPNAFGQSWFVTSALNHLCGDRDVQIAQVWRGDARLIGLIPLTRYSRYGRMPARHVSNWTHYQSFMGTPLIARGHEALFWCSLIKALDASDWATGFLSLTGLAEHGAVHKGLCTAAAALGRRAATVHRFERALLASELDGEAYLNAYVRPKKRKEYRRQANRLADLGTVNFSRLSDPSMLADWCQTFLTLEAASWKGRKGAALANFSGTAQFFRDVISGAHAYGRLDFQRLDLDGRAIAMLINFRTPPGSWSFKIAYDENLARFSPGVLIELENLSYILGDPQIDWMDSCAAPDHPMINSLWGERRAIIQVTVQLSGAKRSAIFHACRAAEIASAGLRHFRMAGFN